MEHTRNTRRSDVRHGSAAGFELAGDSAKDPGAERHVLRFEVSGDVLATVREALAKLRREAGGPLDDDAALLLMARQVLGGPRDDGSASYQVAITVCEACARATQTGRGESLQILPEIAEMARCDAQLLESSLRNALRAAGPCVEGPVGVERIIRGTLALLTRDAWAKAS